MAFDRDYRAMGPFITCPACDCAAAISVIWIDPETQMVGMYALDVECFECGAIYKTACPADTVVTEVAVHRVDDGEEPIDD